MSLISAIIIGVKTLKVLVIGLLVALSACSQQVPTNAPTLTEFLKESSKPAVLKFYADWCVTCKTYAPVFEKVKEEFSEKVDFFAIDVDQPINKALVKEFQISHIPVTLFVNGNRDDIEKQLAPLKYEALSNKVTKLLTK